MRAASSLLPVLLTGGGLLLTGCAGKPTTYLALTPATQAASASIRPANPAISALAVSSVQIPPAIDRPQFTSATAPGIVHVAGDTQWAGPLGPMARTVLAQDLAARLDCTVLMPGDPLPPGGAATAHVTIQNFMPDAAGNVTLQADWFVIAPDGHASLASGRFYKTLQGNKQPAAEVQSMSLVLGELADAIAAGLARA